MSEIVEQKIDNNLYIKTADGKELLITPTDILAKYVEFLEDYNMVVDWVKTQIVETLGYDSISSDQIILTFVPQNGNIVYLEIRSA